MNIKEHPAGLAVQPLQQNEMPACVPVVVANEFDPVQPAALAPLETPVAVSYTHLDVYKRQVYAKALRHHQVTRDLQS